MLLTTYLLMIGAANAQTVSSIPADVSNDRFATEYFSMQRPGLSVNGFDNSGDENKGLGLKQVLNLALNGDEYISDKLDDIFTISDDPIVSNNPNDDQIENNSRILQYTAFEALASYVLEENGINQSMSSSFGLNIRKHSDIMPELKSKLIFVSSYSIYQSQDQTVTSVYDTRMVKKDGDYVKNVKSFQNIARAVDLYLALENAYKEWDYNEWLNSNSNILLSSQEKHELNITLKGATERMYNWLYDGYGVGINAYEVESGNRPLKGFLVMGYTSLAVQNPFEHSAGTSAGIQERQDFDNSLGSGASDFFNISTIGRFNDAKHRASSSATGGDPSTKYWMYQSSNGQREWAEGPYYFDYALADAIPFWHAVRINGLLGSVPDPFKGSNKWFLNPVEWLADVSTPDGYSPPIDDGNKFRLRATDFLRWDNVYGDATVGGKFATVYNNTLKYHGTPENQVESEPTMNLEFNNYQYLIDIAIPKRSTSSTISLPSLTSASEQQFIQRFTDTADNEHYIFFNKEYGNAIIRGEGHEQPDQMQLLYYINDNSYLVDAGYDSAPTYNNDFRNGYFYHNVMHYSYRDYTKVGEKKIKENKGGLESPYVSTAGRKKSRRNHQDVTDSFYRNVSGNSKVTAFEGSLDIEIDYWTGGLRYIGDLNRRVVMVLDDEPYIIDFNRILEIGMEYSDRLKMHYFGNSNEFYEHPDINQWSYWTIDHGLTPTPGSQNAMNLYISALSADPVDDDSTHHVGDYFTDKNMLIQEYENKIAGSKVPYFVQRKMYAKRNNEKEFGLVTFIKASEHTPQNSIVEISAGNDVHAGYFEHGSNMDVAILRQDPSGNKNISFEKDDQQIELALSDGEDYGFVRLKYQSGFWQADPDYTINIEQKGHFFAGGGNITSNTVFTDDVYIMADEDNLAIGADVTFAFGSTVYFMGEQPKINTYGSGKIIANYVHFKGVSTSSEGVLISSSNNQITNSTFEGHTTGLKINSGTGNVIEGNTFEDNSTGLSAHSGTDVTLKNNKFIDNNYGVYTSGYLYLHDEEQPGVYIYPNEFTNNDIGIRGSINAQIHSYRSRFSGNNDNVQLYGSATFYPGFSYTGNAFYDTNDKHIYNNTSGFVNADYQYWNNGGYPNSNQFYGFVSNSNRLTSDPTLITYDEECDDSGTFICQDPGGPGGPGGPGVAIIASATTGELNNSSSKKKGKLQRQSTKVVSRLDEFYGSLRSSEKRDEYVSNAVSINEILSRYAFDGSKYQWSNFEKELGEYLAANILNTSQRSTRINGQNEREVVSLEQNKLLVSLYLNALIAQGKFQDLIKFHDRKLTDHEYLQGDVQLLSYKLQAFIMLGEYEKANVLIHTYDFFAVPEGDSDGSNNAKISTASNQEFIEFQKSLVLLNGKEFGEVTVNQKADDTNAETIVENFTLDSAYPNPFNPSTVIPFTLKEQGNVKVSVYDIMGREVNVIADRVFSSGQHRVTFDANGLSSGIYLIRVWHNGQTFTKRVTLLK